MMYIDPLGLDTSKVGSTQPIRQNDNIVLDDGSVVKSALAEVSIVGEKPSDSDVLGDFWNSPMARSLVADKLTVSLSSSVTAVGGFSKALSFDFITKGQMLVLSLMSWLH